MMQANGARMPLTNDDEPGKGRNMDTTKNKQLLESIYAEMEKGNIQLFIDSLALRVPHELLDSNRIY